jgi:biopolymer transport protein ExbD
MKSAVKGCLAAAILIVGIGAQTPDLRKGVAVQMPVASHAVEMWAADEQKAVVVAIAANGRVFVGAEPTEPDALNRLIERTVYVKGDVRAPYQTVLEVLDALHGKSVVLLSAHPEPRPKQGYAPPYGTKLSVSK